MDLKQLQTFVTTVELGSISRAASVLHLAQPSLSRQIALLEEDLNERLLTRTGRGVVTTDAGETLLRHARILLDQAERARKDIRDLGVDPTGRVTIGLPPRVSIRIAVPLVEQFRARFPRASLAIVEGLSLSLREQLIAGRLDVALLFDPMPSPALALEPLIRENLQLVGPPGAELPERLTLRALAGYPMVMPGSPNALRRVVDAALQPKNLRLDVVAEVGAVQTALALVVAGVGYTILPDSALMQSPAAQSLARAKLGPPQITSVLALALPKHTPIPRLTRAVVEIAGELTRAKSG